MKELISALIKAQPHFKSIRKDKINPYVKSKYADLDSVIAATKDALRANGLLISQTTSVNESRAILVTTLWHESGQKIEGNYPLTKTEDPQKLGASITYARRYALCAILGITADDDNDGDETLMNSANKTVAPIQ
ncbi:ERF family protein [Merismopedia glauca]|nr:ERF family protein [Merismopedia glauca]